MRTVANPVRGCGRKKKGGCYLEATLSEKGTLAPFYWLQMGPRINISPRSMELYTTDELYDMYEIPLPWDYLLMDHVGKQHYTINEFALECMLHGPSRRVNPFSLPEEVRFPLCVVFTHDEADVVDGITFKPYHGTVDPVPNTWEHPDWGIHSDEYNGHDHPRVALYALFDQLKEQRKYSEYIAMQNLVFSEAMFGGSVFTHGIYVLRDDENEAPPEIAVRGFEAARLEEDTEED